MYPAVPDFAQGWNLLDLGPYRLQGEKLLGFGQYGQVGLGRAVEGGAGAGQPLAIKRELVFSAELPPEHAKRECARATQAFNSRRSFTHARSSFPSGIYRELVIMRHLCSPLSGRAHPNLVPLLDVRGPPAPLPPVTAVFLVMPQCGDSLSHLRAKLPLALPVVRDLCWQLLQALRYVHGAGFVHRDIKGANVLLGPLEEGAPNMGGARTMRLRLIDFGGSLPPTPHPCYDVKK